MISDGYGALSKLGSLPLKKIELAPPKHSMMLSLSLLNKVNLFLPKLLSISCLSVSFMN